MEPAAGLAREPSTEPVNEPANGPSTEPAGGRKPPSRALTVAAGLVGNVLEWYDFAVFGTFAADLGLLFFPSDDPTASLMETFAVFGGAFLMRPLGGVIFGYIGDRVGRRRALMVSVILMAVSSFLIGCLPTYEMIGVWATVLLTLIRLVQGVSVGGELIGSILFLVESAPRNRRGMYGSLCLCSAVGGTTLGNIVGVIVKSSMSEADFLSWGWRIPFLLGIAVGVFGLLLRSHIPEPAAFEAARQRQRHLMKTNPIKTAFRDHWREMGLVTGASLFWIAGVWVFTTWLPQYLTYLAAHPTPGAFIISTVASLVFVLTFPAFGLLSDRYGRRRIMLIGTIGMTLMLPPLFWLYNFGMIGTTVTGVALQAFFMAFVGSPLPTWMVEGFPAHVRYSAVAIGYNIVTAVFGGTAPLIATAIVAANPEFIYGPALYLSGLALTASIVIFITPRVLGTRNHLDEDLADGADGHELLDRAAAHGSSSSAAVDDDDAADPMDTLDASEAGPNRRDDQDQARLLTGAGAT